MFIDFNRMTKKEIYDELMKEIDKLRLDIRRTENLWDITQTILDGGYGDIEFFIDLYKEINQILNINIDDIIKSIRSYSDKIDIYELIYELLIKETYKIEELLIEKYPDYEYEIENYMEDEVRYNITDNYSLLDEFREKDLDKYLENVIQAIKEWKNE